MISRIVLASSSTPRSLALLYIDGEAVACDDNGVTLNCVRYRHRDESIFPYAFDLIEPNGCTRLSTTGFGHCPQKGEGPGPGPHPPTRQMPLLDCRGSPSAGTGFG